MEFDYTIKKALPPLSWLAVLKNNSESILVYAGCAVEVFDDFFVSGVWDGDFEQGDFEHCNFACCTGARLKGDNVMFLTPHHINACIFGIKDNDTLILSNSVSFLLAYTDNCFDPDYYEYDKDFCCETLGFRNLNPPYHSSTPLLNNKRLNIYSFTKILIDRNHSIKLEKRKSDFQFTSFYNYRKGISVTLNLILSNSNSNKRKNRYGMIATLSRGYDATTCAVLAKESGCDEAFTFNRPSHYEDDCGTEIARILGYSTVHECDGDFAKTNTEYLEAADFASGDSGVLVTFEAYKDLFRNKLLFCGFQGDEFWGIDHPPYDNLYYPIEGSNSNSYEVFLQSNTVLIMIPNIGADHASKIYEIALSEEMSPWRLGVKYDRPICRRIVEEAGVPREMFGQKKVGAGYCFHYDTLKTIGKKMSPQSYQSLLNFSKELKQNPLKKIKAYCRFIFLNIPIYLPHVLNKFHINLKMKKWNKEHLSNPVSTTYILWGVDHMKKYYKDAMTS